MGTSATLQHSYGDALDRLPAGCIQILSRTSAGEMTIPGELDKFDTSSSRAPQHKRYELGEVQTELSFVS